MELMETATMMGSKDYKERFKAEYYQVKIRAEKLKAMLEKYKTGTLNFTPSCSYELLYAQLVHMKDYESCLSERALIEGIDLKEV